MAQTFLIRPGQAEPETMPEPVRRRQPEALREEFELDEDDAEISDSPALSPAQPDTVGMDNAKITGMLLTRCGAVTKLKHSWLLAGFVQPRSVRLLFLTLLRATWQPRDDAVPWLQVAVDVGPGQRHGRSREARLGRLGLSPVLNSRQGNYRQGNNHSWLSGIGPCV